MSMSHDDELFDRALSRFLAEEAASAREINWVVKAEAGREWEVALWRNDDYAGTWRITADSHSRLDEPEPTDEPSLVAAGRAPRGTPMRDHFGAEMTDRLAAIGIDLLCAPPERIDTATTRVGSRLVAEGRALLEEAGVDWRKIIRDRERERAARQASS